DELVLAVPNNDNYPMNINQLLDTEILLSEKIIFRKEGSGTRKLIKQKLLEENISLDDLNIEYLIDSNEMIKKMIELELGISFISELSIKNEIDLGLIKPFKIKNLDLRRKFYFVYCKNRTLSPLVEVF